MSGTAQAQHFLRNTLFRKGDLPPVLDLEPYPSQIAAMGGTQVLFRNVRAWLQAVERHTHAKPILYVSQSFVNRYLSEAPDLKRDYQVWIARYGEYKPDVKLAVWQLSPNGRVTGIHGEVDINVFNGYRTQWEEFIEEMTVK
jgi:lysozyme